MATSTKAKTEVATAPPDLRTGVRRGHEPGEAPAPREPYDGGVNLGALAREKATGDLPTGARSHITP